MLNRDTDYQRNNFLISKERITRQVIAGCWLSVFLAGVYLRKWDFLKPNTLDSSLFFLKQTSQSEIVFQERKAQNVILVQLYYL